MTSESNRGGAARTLTDMLRLLYYAGRFLQLLAMSLLLMAIVTAGPLGPSPRIFGAGVGVFVVGWLIIRGIVKK